MRALAAARMASESTSARAGPRHVAIARAKCSDAWAYWPRRDSCRARLALSSNSQLSSSMSLLSWYPPGPVTTGQPSAAGLVSPQPFPQLADVRVHLDPGRSWRNSAPQRVYEHADRHGSPRIERQGGQKHPLLHSGQRNQLTTVAHFEWTEHVDAHFLASQSYLGRAKLAAVMGSLRVTMQRQITGLMPTRITTARQLVASCRGTVRPEALLPPLDPFALLCRTYHTYSADNYWPFSAPDCPDSPGSGQRPAGPAISSEPGR